MFLGVHSIPSQRHRLLIFMNINAEAGEMDVAYWCDIDVDGIQTQQQVVQQSINQS